MFTMTNAENVKPGDRIIGSLANMIVLEVITKKEWSTVEITMHHILDKDIVSYRTFMKGTQLKVANY